MNEKPSIEQFMNAEFTIMPAWAISDAPTITVENCMADPAFYFDVTLEEFAKLNSEALGNDDAPDYYVNRVLEIEAELSDSYNRYL